MTRAEVVVNPGVVAARQEAFDSVAADIARAARDENTHAETPFRGCALANWLRSRPGGYRETRPRTQSVRLIFRCYARPRHTSVMSSCCARPVACCLTALSKRSHMLPGTKEAPWSAASIPL